MSTCAIVPSHVRASATASHHMSTPLTIADVERIATLAHLELTPEEKQLFTQQLADILSYAEQVQAIDTTGVAATAHVNAHEARAGRSNCDPPCQSPTRCATRLTARRMPVSSACRESSDERASQGDPRDCRATSRMAGSRLSKSVATRSIASNG